MCRQSQRRLTDSNYSQAQNGFYSSREDKSFKASSEELELARIEFLNKGKNTTVITLDDVTERGVLSGKRKRGGWHGASPGKKASGIKGEVEDETAEWMG